MKIYTRKGDDGTTGLLYGGRAWKDDPGPEAYGAVDEAVSALGAARVLAEGELAGQLLRAQRDLFVVGAELATRADNRHKLQDGISRAEQPMIDRLEGWIDALEATTGMPTEFVVPGGTPLAAALDVARTVVRRAERRCVTYARSGGRDGSMAVPYLNRLADYLFMAARSAEDAWLPTRDEEDE